MWRFYSLLAEFWTFFEDFIILTGKQRMKPKNLTSWKNFASFDALIVTESAKVVEIHSAFSSFTKDSERSGGIKVLWLQRRFFIE